MLVSNKPSAMLHEEDTARVFVDVMDAFISRLMLATPHGTPPINLSPHEIRSLMWINRHPGCVMSEFARGLGVPLSTASSLADRLVEKGFLQRQRLERDRRAIEISLSDMGKRVDKRFYTHRLSAARKVLENLLQNEQRDLVHLLNKALRSPDGQPLRSAADSRRLGRRTDKNAPKDS